MKILVYTTSIAKKLGRRFVVQKKISVLNKNLKLKTFVNQIREWFLLLN